MKTLFFVIASLCCSLLPGAANAAGWEFVGSWRLNVTCRGFTQVNTLSISEANGKRVLGTSNVNDGFGKIVGGSFDGQNVTFTNKFKWNGHNYTEKWTGKLSGNGKSLKGAFSSNNDSGGCSFRGSRI